jgi:hypothetical protein
MALAQSLIDALDERELAQRIGIPHDEVRLRYHLRSNTVRDAQEFERVIGDYVAYHHEACISPGGRLRDFEAVSRAKQILQSVYRRRNQTLLNAVADGVAGLNGGMMGIINHLADALKEESIENYIEDTIDRHVQIDSWSQKVALMRDLLAHYGHVLPESIRIQPPEKFAADYKALVRGLVEGLRESKSAFRRV